MGWFPQLLTRRNRKVVDRQANLTLDITCYRFSRADIRRIICPLSGLSKEDIRILGF